MTVRYVSHQSFLEMLKEGLKDNPIEFDGIKNQAG